MATQLSQGGTEPDFTIRCKLMAAADILEDIASGKVPLPEWLPGVRCIIDAAEAMWTEAQR